jgi:hypothetical protein
LKSSLAWGIAALHMIEPRADRPTPITLGADKAYDSEDFVNELRSMNATPHVAQNTSGRIPVEDASLVSLDPQADQIARDVVALRQPMERLARETLLSHPALELDAVRTMPGHGLPSFESPAWSSNLRLRPVRPEGSTPLGGEADHLAQNVGVGGLLHERAKAHHFVGHRWFLGCIGVSQPDPTGDSPVTPASRSLATALWGARFASGLLPPSCAASGDTISSARRPA